jgi:hypothetical protein
MNKYGVAYRNDQTETVEAGWVEESSYCFHFYEKKYTGVKGDWIPFKRIPCDAVWYVELLEDGEDK